ncbi:MAG: ABC transporter substrate-binding protein [Eubacteriales bacterium]
MLKKAVTWILYGIMICYIIFAPYYLNNIFSEKFLENSSNEEWSGVITLWDVPRLTVNGSEFGWIKGRIASYHKHHPNIHIELRELHYEDNNAIAFAGALSDDHPDILPLFVNQELIPLDNAAPTTLFNIEKEAVHIQKEFLTTVTEKDIVWGVPVYYSTNVLIINKDLLQSLGIKIPEEWTYANFNSLLKEINEKDVKNEIVPFDFYIEKGSYSYIPFLLSDGGTIFYENKIDFYHESILTGLKRLTVIKDTIDNLPANFGARSKNEVYNDFLNLKKTVIIAGNLSDINAVLRKQNAGSGFEFIVSPYPKSNNGDSVKFADEIGAYVMMKTEDHSKQKAIQDFLAFLLEEESQNSVEIMGKLPVITNYPYQFEQYKHLNQLYSDTTVQVVPFYRNRSAIDEEIQLQIKKYLIENQPSTETLYQMEQNIEKLINDGKY